MSTAINRFHENCKLFVNVTVVTNVLILLYSTNATVSLWLAGASIGPLHSLLVVCVDYYGNRARQHFHVIHD